MCTAKRMIPGCHTVHSSRAFLKVGKRKYKAMSNVILRQPGMTFEQRKRAIGMLTAGMSARDVARHF